MNHRQAAMIGARLGVLQGAALSGPPATLVFFATDHLWLAGEMLLISVLGWVGWQRETGLKWRPWG